MKRVEQQIIFELRQYKKIELREKLNLSKYFFNVLIKRNQFELGIIEGTLLSIAQVKILVLKSGIPYKVMLE